MKDVDYLLLGHKDTRDLVEGSQRFYALHDIESLKHMNVHRDVAIILSTIVHNDDLLRIVKTEKGDVINMCTSLDRLVEESKNKGISIGEEQGKHIERMKIFKKLIQDCQMSSEQAFQILEVLEQDRPLFGVS